jgi:hypothetical protein
MVEHSIFKEMLALITIHKTLKDMLPELVASSDWHKTDRTEIAYKLLWQQNKAFMTSQSISQIPYYISRI